MSVELQQEFVRRLQRRLARGAEEYGDASLKRPLAETVEEMLQEVEDIAGWAFVMWVQLRTRLNAVVQAAQRSDDGHA